LENNAEFEVVRMNPIYTAANISSGTSPAIASFTASSQAVSAGTPVTLNWNVTRASYAIVSPSQSTTYTLYATNAFGRTTATLNINVH
jgi:hypothetical protein